MQLSSPPITSRTGIGIIASAQDWIAKGGSAFVDNVGGAGWNVKSVNRDACQDGKKTEKGSACAAGNAGQRVVLEADGRDETRTRVLLRAVRVMTRGSPLFGLGAVRFC
ncbi:hypothetical protein BLNAU_17503 [Blattamonas nauphoetae]|uniref:Uncharacterized protein n=1 Tax=Blattamonas nauphoetae TaxID=2049346 RepID=A0ABQ9X8J6_9EUKA|nr:hypothetical protein BLNAU_17503 [Blattamonas nauphoetae]